jgi:hypothetical protein
MPKRMTAKSVEIGLMRCREEAAMLDDDLLLYLLDVTLLHLRRKAARPDPLAEVILGAIRSGYPGMMN